MSVLAAATSSLAVLRDLLQSPGLGLHLLAELAVLLGLSSEAFAQDLEGGQFSLQRLLLQPPGLQLRVQRGSVGRRGSDTVRS